MTTQAQQHCETHHPGGWPRIYPYDGLWRRLREAWWILSNQQSLHRAWQSGYDCHIQDESARRARGVGAPVGTLGALAAQDNYQQ
jgi:hypothetical protein